MDGPADSPTLREAASTYLASLPAEERQEAQADVHRFVRWYGSDRRMSEMTGHDVSWYADSLGVALTDVAGRLEPVRGFLAFAKKKGFTATNLGVHLRPPKTLKAAKSGQRGKEEEAVDLTREGIEALEAELQELRARRPQIAADLRRAMADKDFRENAPLDAAREQQAHVEARIRDLDSILRRAIVIDGERARAGGRRVVEMGSVVHLRNLKSGSELKYTLVGPRETDPGQGKISIASPVGKALVNKAQGEEVEVEAPAGAIRFRIEKIEV